MSKKKQCCAPLRRKRMRLLEYEIHANDQPKNQPFKYPTNSMTTTKYTPYSFVPRFLYEQFRRLPNLYFLFVSAITCIPGISPISPVSAVLPFVLIILTAAVKEAFEDFRRWQSDLEINNRIYEVLRPSGFVSLKNKYILVGDILHLHENQEVPADMLLIATSEKDGICYVDTANLDGETTLKLFKALPETCNWNEQEIINIKAVIRAGPPIEKLTEFKGNVRLGNQPALEESEDEDDLLSLNSKQLLLRGVRIRNTKNVYGVVLYAGKQTKLALNAVSPPSKFSQTERYINFASLAIFTIKMSLVIYCTVASTISEVALPLWYAPVRDTSLDAGTVFMSYFVLLGYFIPISLFVNLELLKLVQAGWMMGDEDMMLQQKPMRVKNSSLNDELSRVSYIFSDKTGTLTQNKMIFDQCSINSKKYDHAGSGGLRSLVGSDAHVREFLLNMALNNEVLPDDSEKDQEHSQNTISTAHKLDEHMVQLDGFEPAHTGNTDENAMPKYAAPSPDEIALVKGAFMNGVQFLSRSNEGIKIRFELTRETNTYQILNVMEFTSERKRSSVIVRNPTGEIVMYTKGADSAIKSRLSQSSNIPEIEAHLSEYSKVGLRTLLFGRKELSEEDYKKFTKKYNYAAASIENREQQLAIVNDEMEQDLDLQGCSAIQDALQDQVPFTIAYLIKAGIKVWMITGDQQDTAENIGYSCELITQQSKIVRVVKCENSERCKEALLAAREEIKPGAKVSLVIDGQSLVYALIEHDKLFLSVGKDCETVIVCRADPLQKALVVRLIKRGTKKITLSIGDGANDVSMLQEAHIGVGIWGEEGTQAAQNADYAIRLFKHLAKLVTVHGRYNMMRTAIMVEFSFYKNLAMFGCQFWYAFYNRHSAQTFFDDWVMASYNTVILSLPPLALAFFEKDLSEEAIMKYPQTYRELQRGLYFTLKTFCRWMFSAACHSTVIFFSMFLLSDIVKYDGHTFDIFLYSTFAATAGVFAIVLKAAMVTRHWVWPNHAAYWLSYIAVFGLLLIESDLPDMFPAFYMVMQTAMQTAYFWFLILIVCAICIVPEICFEYCQRIFFPYDWQIVQEINIADEGTLKTVEQLVEEEDEIRTDDEFHLSELGGKTKKEKLKKGWNLKTEKYQGLNEESSSSSSSSSEEEMETNLKISYRFVSE